MFCIISRLGVDDREFDKYLLSPNKFIFITEERHVDGLRDKKLKAYSVISLNDANEVLNLFRTINNEIKISQIISTSEHDVLLCARIREKYNISGMKPSHAMAYRDKFVMKELLKDCSSFSIPKYKKVSNSIELKDFYTNIDGKIIIKPLAGSGSRDVFELNNLREIERFTFESEFLAEEFIQNKMLHVDGILVDNDFHSFEVSKYISDCLYHKRMEILSSFSINENESLYKKCKKSMQEIFSKLPTCSPMFFHCEFFVDDKNEELTFCEIAIRPGGGPIVKQLDIKYKKRVLFDFYNLHDPEFTNAQTIKEKFHSCWIMVPKNIVKNNIDLTKLKDFDWVIDWNVKPKDSNNHVISSIDVAFTCNFIARNENDYIEKIRTLQILSVADEHL